MLYVKDSKEGTSYKVPLSNIDNLCLYIATKCFTNQFAIDIHAMTYKKKLEIKMKLDVNQFNIIIKV